VLGGAAAVLVLAALATQGSAPARPPSVVPPAPGEPSPPAEIRATPPAGMDGKQTRDWNKIIEELERGHFEDARHKLRDFVARYGQTDETRELGPQLDALGPDLPGRPDGRGRDGPRGRGKKHHDD
jgi:hypothetical protein